MTRRRPVIYGSVTRAPKIGSEARGWGKDVLPGLYWDVQTGYITSWESVLNRVYNFMRVNRILPAQLFDLLN